MASGHVEAALSALVQIAAGGRSETARVSAACAILDRAYGRPRQTVEVEGVQGHLAAGVLIVEPELREALDGIAERLGQL